MISSKPSVKPAVDDVALGRIRSAVSALGKHQRGGVVDLVAAVDGGRMTVDFDAAKSLGHPLVVVEAPRATPPWFDSLSPREREVCVGLREGKSNRELADQLFISVATVKDHVHNILSKAQLRRRGQISAAFADDG